MSLRLLFVTALFALIQPAIAHATSNAGTPTLQPFNASYKVLRGGDDLGTSTLTLAHNDDGTWTFSSKLAATHGLAALIGGSVSETSRFRWHADQIEALTYGYRLHTAFKSRHRHVKVDWAAHTVTVDSSRSGTFTYASQPGLVERHLLVLALGLASMQQQQDIALPVAVKDRVQTQTYQAHPPASITVPAGQFTAVRIDRTHDSKGYSVWFAPGKLGPIPVKLKQDSGGHITLLLRHATTTPKP